MRILWHSNAPWMKTGYGQQTAIWTERLRDLGHDVAIAGYAGAQHIALDWKGMTVFPAGVENGIGMDGLGYYCELHRADLVISLCDAWALSPRLMALMNTVCWTPVDAEPLGEGLKSFFRDSGARPLAMSLYGQRLMQEAGLDASYIPHGIPTDVFRPPEDRDALRAASGYGRDTFVVGMNQANRSGLRKALPEQIGAFLRFHQRHPDSKLMLHMSRDHPKGQDLPLLIDKILDRLGFEGNHEDIVFFPDSGSYAAGALEMEDMAAVYGGLDVLMQVPMAGGFELPALEAQACGTPVIGADSSAVAEVAGAHSWLVPGQDFWVEERHAGFWTMPLMGHACSACGHVDGIEAALEAAWEARESGDMPRRRQEAREHALGYDADLILHQFWEPYLGALEAGLYRSKRVRTAAPKDGRTIWSPVMFRDEAAMLQMRLAETEGWVDRHVIVEADMTHRGHPKPLHFRDHRGQFARYDGQITVVAAQLDAAAEPWVNEHAQRDAAWPFIDAEAADDDVVLICDVDEIPSQSLLERAKAGDLPEVCSVWMRTTLFAVDWEVPSGAVPPTCVVATAGYIRAHGGSLAGIRDKRLEYPCVTDGGAIMVGGWHFSWLGGPEAQRAKLETATCHTELLGTAEAEAIASGERWREGGHTAGHLPVVAVEVDESWPQWIRDRRCPDEWFRPRETTTGPQDWFRERLETYSDIQGHLEFLYRTASAYRAPVIVELGVRSGVSTAAFLAAAELAGGQVWSCDIESPAVPDEWLLNPLWCFIDGNDLSEAVMSSLPAECDVLFIDTSHDFAQTVAELEMYMPRLRPGGVALLHDTCWEVNGLTPNRGVAKALDEWCDRHGMTWENREGSYGLGVIHV